MIRSAEDVHLWGIEQLEGNFINGVLIYPTVVYTNLHSVLCTNVIFFLFDLVCFWLIFNYHSLSSRHGSIRVQTASCAYPRCYLPSWWNPCSPILVWVKNSLLPLNNYLSVTNYVFCGHKDSSIWSMAFRYTLMRIKNGLPNYIYITCWYIWKRMNIKNFLNKARHFDIHMRINH